MFNTRITERFEAMLRQGLVEKVDNLRARFDLKLVMHAMRCVGYRQTWLYLDGEMALDELRDRGIYATRQLAKRQITWLRAWQDAQVLDCLDPNLRRSLEFTLQQFLNAQ